MTYRVLGWFGIALGLACWAGLVTLRVIAFGETFVLRDVVVEMALVFGGSLVFWRWIVSMLARQAAEVRQRTDHLEALYAASIALTTEHELTSVLQLVVDQSRSLLNAKYGALGILDEDGTGISQMITSGLSPTQRAALQQFPHGHGLLGAPIAERRAVRVSQIAADPRSRGFPPNHPAMSTFLGVPIISKGRIFGNLYLADKQPGPDAAIGSARSVGPLPFAQEDQEILEMFANQAAIAIENAQLYRQNQQIAVLQERERFGMDLHDGVIQSIYAIGLLLDESRHRAEEDATSARQGIDAAIHGLNQVIKDIRSYIHDLRTQQFESRNLQQGLEELARDLQTYSVLSVDVAVEPAALLRVTPQQTKDILQIVREALSNIRKHAHATRVEIRLNHTGSALALAITDNGVGLPAGGDFDTRGYGLRNMAERALRLRGDLVVRPLDQGGTAIEVTIPL
jgi:signal transduction histidine kinase